MTRLLFIFSSIMYLLPLHTTTCHTQPESTSLCHWYTALAPHGQDITLDKADDSLESTVLSHLQPRDLIKTIEAVTSRAQFFHDHYNEVATQLKIQAQQELLSNNYLFSLCDHFYFLLKKAGFTDYLPCIQNKEKEIDCYFAYLLEKLESLEKKAQLHLGFLEGLKKYARSFLDGYDATTCLHGLEVSFCVPTTYYAFPPSLVKKAIRAYKAIKAFNNELQSILPFTILFPPQLEKLCIPEKEQKEEDASYYTVAHNTLKLMKKIISKEQCIIFTPLLNSLLMKRYSHIKKEEVVIDIIHHHLQKVFLQPFASSQAKTIVALSHVLILWNTFSELYHQISKKE